MAQTITLRLDEQTDRQLDMLSQALGFSKELSAIYAVRLVSACMREGLIKDMPARVWPREAQLLTQAKVLAFPGAASDAGSHA